MRKKNVLIVDGDGLFAWGIRKELTVRGFDVRTAPTGQDCLAAIRDTPYDFLFIDTRLPDMNGIELLGKLRNISPSSRLVLLSSDGSARNKEAALSAGAAQFLEKPLKTDMICRFVASTSPVYPCRRKRARYLCDFALRLTICTPAPDEKHFFLKGLGGTAEDVAPEGIRLSTNYPLRRGQGVRLEIDGEPDPFGKMIPVGADAEVVWSVSREDLSTAGLRFLVEPSAPA